VQCAELRRNLSQRDNGHKRAEKEATGRYMEGRYKEVKRVLQGGNRVLLGGNIALIRRGETTITAKSRKNAKDWGRANIQDDRL